MAAPSAPPKPTDRVPPSNLEAERSVLGSLLLMNEAIDEVAEFLSAKHFYSDRHQAIYTAIHELYEQVDGLIGDSILSYDPVRKQWQQTWVTNRGSIMVIVGNVKDGALILEGEAHVKDGFNGAVRDSGMCRSLPNPCLNGFRWCEPVCGSIQDRDTDSGKKGRGHIIALHVKRNLLGNFYVPAVACLDDRDAHFI